MENYIVSRFSGIRSTKPTGVETLENMLAEIKSDKHKSKVEEIRSHENPTKSPIKEKLPVFTPTGIFNHRSIAGLESYNGIICLDIDHVEDAKFLKSKAAKLNYVLAAFITPSGKGLKVLIKTNATPETYKEVEAKVASAFQHDTGAIRDNHCKDISRIQFLSHDPEIYVNYNAKNILI